ncbi:lysoplasmalogenase [Mycoplasma marinum]|uniref:lysoplasmalogenase n=1 Tax=Mycoplasma marinum TaxID=1937190 RepID=UPI003B31F022
MTKINFTWQFWISTILWILLSVLSISHLWYLENYDGHTFTINIIRSTKSLILPVLLSIFIINRFKKWKREYWLIIFALLFAFIGDVLLIEWTQSDALFLGGLAAFLIGHIFSIIYIFKNSNFKKNKYKWIVTLPFIFVPFVIWQISTLDSVLIAIAIFFYSLMLCTLLGLSLTLIFTKESIVYTLAIIGSSLFVISDMILGLKTFKHIQFPATTVIWTYICAQVFLTLFYLRSSKN